MAKLSSEELEELVRYGDRIFYAAMGEGFSSKEAREMSEKAIAKKRKEMMKAKNPSASGARIVRRRPWRVA
jgi:hypothetical protein